jgi:hypothetical protein
MADDQQPDGLMATCRRCGGRNARTGRERLGPLLTGLGNTKPERVKSAEWRCTQCGATTWGDIGTVETE